MGVAGAKEEVVVTAEAPVLDNKKQTTATSVSFEELQNVPTARDPWVVMQSVPGIVMDRVNVGGSESGQQAGFIGKGAGSGRRRRGTWTACRSPTCPRCPRRSTTTSTCSRKCRVVTGGADPKSATGGVQMNFMLKSGTNVFHGSAQGLLRERVDAVPATCRRTCTTWSKDPVTGQPTGKGDRTEQFLDWGGELGGPILKDQWWFWVSYGKQDIRILKLSGTHDRTILPNLSFKTQGQITKSMRGSFTFFQANKQKWGRNASPTRPQETTCNQDGPNSMYKGEINYNVGNNLFLVGRYAYTKGGFTFDPAGRHGQGRLPGRRRRVAQLVLQLHHRPPAERVRHRRQLLQGEPRDQVRVHLEEDRRPLRQPVAGLDELHDDFDQGSGTDASLQVDRAVRL